MTDPRRDQLREQAKNFEPRRYMPIISGELTTLLDMLDRVEAESLQAWAESRKLRAALDRAEAVVDAARLVYRQSLGLDGDKQAALVALHRAFDVHDGIPGQSEDLNAREAGRDDRDHEDS